MPSFNDPQGDYNPYAPPTAADDVPESAGDEYQILAERGTRWWARFVDQLLTILAALPAVFGFVSEANGIGAGLLLFPLGFLCYQWYLVATTGQTLAKKWMGIKIVKMDGSRVDFVSGVLLREWLLLGASAIPYIGGFIGLVDAVMIFNQERRCLHDQIAGTKVILAMPSI
jgi:uncharacterized RDD family membrane protein YckC